MPSLTVTLITRNESANIAAALESVSWADEIVVVDAESTDDTAEIARRFTPRVIVRAWPGFVAQKNFAAEQSCHDWILSLDADERVGPALANEIRRVLEPSPPEAGFRMPRVSFYLGRWIRTTDWYPDHQLRLYDRRAMASACLCKSHRLWANATHSGTGFTLRRSTTTTEPFWSWCRRAWAAGR